MKTLKYLSIFFLTLILSVGVLHAQTSGSFWIKSFKPGSSDLNEPGINKAALEKLDRLMKNPDIDVTFLGAADSLGWQLDGKRVHPDVSEAWNDAKRLSRARVLQARYKRGNVGITYENIAGVKVLWSLKNQENYTEELRDLSKELSSLKDQVANMQPEFMEIEAPRATTEQSKFDWGLEAGFWTWQGGTHGSLFSPSLALKIIINSTAFMIQGGVTPWHISTEFGNQSESFVYMGIKHMKSKVLGVTIGAFRGWEFFTANDSWSFKTTGLSSGIVIKHGILEINPAVTYSNINTLTTNSTWKFGANLGFTLNINEAFKRK